MVTTEDIDLMRGKNDVDGLIKVLEESNELIKIKALNALGFLLDRKAVDPIVNTLNDSSPNVRRVAAKVLSKFKDKRAVPALIEMIDDDDLSVQKQVVETLGDLRDDNAIKPLIKIIEDKEKKYDPSLKEVASISIGKLNTLEAFKIIETEIQESENELQKSMIDGKGYRAEDIKNRIKILRGEEKVISEKNEEAPLISKDDIESKVQIKREPEKEIVQEQPDIKSSDVVNFCPQCGQDMRSMDEAPIFCFNCGKKFLFVEK